MMLASPISGRWRRRSFLAVSGAALVFLLADLVVLISGRNGIMDAPSGTEPSWIVVPGASVRRDGTLSPILESRMEKAREAAAFWPEARILLSGTSIPGGYSEPDAMRTWMTSRRIAVSRIVVDRTGTDTRATIEHLGPPAGSIVVVSQDWHLPRALWCARSAGWDARGLAASPMGRNWKVRIREHFVRVLYFFLLLPA